MNKKVIVLIAVLVVLTISYVILQSVGVGGFTDDEVQSTGMGLQPSSIVSTSYIQTSSANIDTSSVTKNTPTNSTKQTTSSKKTLTSSQVNSAKDKLISDLNGLKE